MITRFARGLAFVLLGAAAALAGGCGSSGSSSPAVTAPSADAQNHFQSLVSGGATADSVAREGSYFADLYAQHPTDPAASLGYSVTNTADAVSRLAAQYGVTAASLAQLSSLQQSLRSDVSGVVQDALSLVSGRGPAGLAGTRAEGSPTPAEVAADLNTILIPALHQSIAALGTAVAYPGVIVSFAGENGTVNIRAVDALAYRAALQEALATIDTAVAYSWDSGSFVWDRPLAEADANGDGLLTPAEYLPGGTFLTLVNRPAMTEAWNSMGAAITDGKQVASIMAAGAPDTLLASAAPEANWPAVQIVLMSVQQALTNPTVLPVPVTLPGSTEPTTLNLTVNPGAFWVSPPSDLRLLAPTLRLAAGTGGETQVYFASIPDYTFGGLLPYGQTEIPAAVWLSLLARPLGP